MAMTEEERKAAEREYKRQWAAAHRVPKVFTPVTMVCANCGVSFTKTTNKPGKKYCSERCGIRRVNRDAAMRRRREAGVAPRPSYTPEELRERKRAAALRSYYKRARAKGVPPAKRLTDAEREANRRKHLAQLAAMFADRPDDRKAIRRKSMTKRRIATALNVPMPEVPKDLLAAQVMVLNVQYTIRRINK